MTDSTFKSELSRLFAAHSKKYEQATADVYYEHLSRLTDSQFEHAVKRSIACDEMFPKVSKLFAYAREVSAVAAAQNTVYFSFMHDACETSFSARRADFENRLVYYRCDECYLHKEHSIYFSGITMTQLMNETVTRFGAHASLAHLTTEHEVKK